MAKREDQDKMNRQRRFDEDIDDVELQTQRYRKYLEAQKNQNLKHQSEYAASLLVQNANIKKANEAVKELSDILGKMNIAERQSITDMTDLADTIDELDSELKKHTNLNAKYSYRLQSMADRLAKSGRTEVEQNEILLAQRDRFIRMQMKENGVTQEHVDVLSAGVSRLKLFFNEADKGANSLARIRVGLDKATESLKSQTQNFFSFGNAMELAKRALTSSYEEMNRLTQQGLLGAMSEITIQSKRMLMSTEEFQKIIQDNRQLVNQLGGGIRGIRSFSHELDNAQSQLMYLGKHSGKAAATMIDLTSKSGDDIKDQKRFREGVKRTTDNFKKFNMMYGDTAESYSDLMLGQQQEASVQARLNTLKGSELTKYQEELRQRTEMLKNLGLSNEQIKEFNKKLESIYDPKKNNYQQRVTESVYMDAMMSDMTRILGNGNDKQREMAANLDKYRTQIQKFNDPNMSDRDKQAMMNDPQMAEAAKAFNLARDEIAQNTEQLGKMTTNIFGEKAGNAGQFLDDFGKVLNTAKRQNLDITGKSPEEIRAMVERNKNVQADGTPQAKLLETQTRIFEGIANSMKNPIIAGAAAVFAAFGAAAGAGSVLAAALTRAAAAAGLPSSMNLPGKGGGKGGPVGKGGGKIPKVPGGLGGAGAAAGAAGAAASGAASGAGAAATGAATAGSAAGAAAGTGAAIGAGAGAVSTISKIGGFALKGAGIAGLLYSLWGIGDALKDYKDDQITEEERNEQIGEAAGNAAGGTIGAILGSMILPGIGTAIGGVLGAWLTGKAGGAIGAAFGEAKTKSEKADIASGKASEKMAETKSSSASKVQTPKVIQPAKPSGTPEGLKKKELVNWRQGVLERAADENGITDPTEKAAFMAQMAHETGGFSAMRELGTNAGRQYEGRRDLGNTEIGDGQRFKGRGYIQLTGRSNYKRYGEMVGVDLIKNPELAEDPNVAAQIAIAYWRDRKIQGKSLGEQAKAGNFDLVTKGINGGFNGKADRDRRYALYRRAYEESGGKNITTAVSEPKPDTKLPQGVVPEQQTAMSQNQVQKSVVFKKEPQPTWTAPKDEPVQLSKVSKSIIKAAPEVASSTIQNTATNVQRPSLAKPDKTESVDDQVKIVLKDVVDRNGNFMMDRDGVDRIVNALKTKSAYGALPVGIDPRSIDKITTALKSMVQNGPVSLNRETISKMTSIAQVATPKPEVKMSDNVTSVTPPLSSYAKTAVSTMSTGDMTGKSAEQMFTNSLRGTGMPQMTQSDQASRVNPIDPTVIAMEMASSGKIAGNETPTQATATINNPMPETSEQLAELRKQTGLLTTIAANSVSKPSANPNAYQRDRTSVLNGTS